MPDHDNPLAKHRAPRDAGAAFCATREGGFAMVEPLTPSATTWLRDRVGDEASWIGGRLAVEPRYFPPLADAIIEAGFLFEREPYPN